MKLFVLLLCVCLGRSLPNKKITSLRTYTGPRIIGGSLARSGQFPFSAAIFTTTLDGNYFCGGALVTDQWVLTAGQCVDGVELFEVHLGTNSLDGSDPYAVKVSADEYVLHPEYDPLSLKNDIGLIWLRLPVEFSDYLKPFEFLPFGEFPAESTAMAIGWGQISDDDPGLASDLRWVYMYSVENLECKIFYGDQITDGMVCAAGDYNEGTCFGDTGSPLVQIVNRDQALIPAIASFVSMNGCESPEPSGFTRVFTYVDWIKNVTGRE
ncbi:brachyurin-like [Zophobas morio]|uniref:brachyurin-like n=1 Tax=Zophobas morio TaxID=2755281 RepID=UPI003082D5CA